MQESIFNRHNISILRQGLWSLLLIVIGLGMSTCQKEEVAIRDYPRLNTLDIADITGSGANFNAEIKSGNLTDITEYGFVWGLNNTPVIGYDDQYTVRKSPSVTNFRANIHTALTKDKIYYVRPYLITPKYTVYGKSVAFKSLGSEAPVISNFSPALGTWGDTIKIIGRNFRSINKAVVIKIGELPAEVVAICDSIIRFVVPAKDNLSMAKLTVSILDQSTVSSNSFIYKIPVIASVSPEYVTFKDTVYIRGTNLITKKMDPKVTLNNLNMSIAFSSENLIKIVIPVSYGVRMSSVNVKGPSGFITSGTTIKFKDLLINSFTPDTIRQPLETITITGSNFNPVLTNNKVLIGTSQAQILESSVNRLVIQLPNAIIPEHDVSVKKGFGITVSTGELSVNTSKNIQVKWESKWTKRNSFPGSQRFSGIAFTIGDKGYFGLGSFNSLLNDFWEYDFKTDLWTRKADFPGAGRVYETGIALNGKGYVGFGSKYKVNENYKDFYQYDPAMDSWTKLADYPGEARNSALSFIANNRIYVGGGSSFINQSSWESYPDDCWSYNPVTNSWQMEPKIPNVSTRDILITIDNLFYKIGNWKVDMFDGTSWSDKGDVPTFNGLTPGILTFQIGSLGYIYKHYDSYYYIYTYQPSTGNTTLIKIPDSVLRYYPSVFTFGNKAYIVGGSDANFVDSQCVWEFDPTKP